MSILNINVYGIVQGVGFRPFVARCAEKYNIKGSVANRGSFVEIFAQGQEAMLDAFIDEIKNRPPNRAVVLNVTVEKVSRGEFTDFVITQSEKEKGDIFVSPDIAVCEECKKELYDINNKRYLHPFINCTQCGPRLTIMDNLPYDRERTTMGVFPMCPDCEREYTDPSTRRFDAQPVCCNKCGPEVYIIGTRLKGEQAIKTARKEIASGKIIAIKGIGGFHLCCDAKNSMAVERLRTLKARPTKPFAVMMKDIRVAERECIVKEGQREYLDGWQKPIMLLEKRENSTLSPFIAPDNISVGVMLPYTPLHLLLFDYPDDIRISDCLVMTSGNVKGAPICRDDEDAIRELSGFCDVFLSHNRKILIRSDDSVTDWLYDKPYMIRRSRGFAPLPFALNKANKRNALAIGGELKNTFCLSKKGLFYPSSYVGDMEDIRTVKALDESVKRMCDLLEVKPDVIVCDKHPGYNTSSFAEELSKKLGLPLIRLQHHYAHVLSVMAEYACFTPVIGISFDGTGYGDDATIWGGEIFVCDHTSYKRTAHIDSFKQCGGDISAKEGWRIAAAVINSSSLNAAEVCRELAICTEEERTIIERMSSLGINSVSSTSCGRLFDAASAVLGFKRASSFEGEAATNLMYHALMYEKRSCEYDKIPLSCENGILSTNSLLTALAIRKLNKEPVDRLAYDFHANLADILTKTCIGIREKENIDTVALSGGCFQNSLLVRLCRERLENNNFKVLLNSLLPVNDGGICLGQAVYGALKEE